jgi:hypothetical protein
MLQALPACGELAGHPARGEVQNHCGGEMVRQTGNIVPPWQSLQLQRVPSPYQHESVVSAQVPVGGAGAQATGCGGVVHSGFGAVRCHVPSHRAVVRHSARGSSPQLQ